MSITPESESDWNLEQGFSATWTREAKACKAALKRIGTFESMENRPCSPPMDALLADLKLILNLGNGS